MHKRKKIVIVTTVMILLIFSGCVNNTNTEHNLLTKKEINVKEFQKLIDSSKLIGSILFFDPQQNFYYSNDFNWAKKSRLPASTFKIPNSIIALETGIAKNDSTILKWNGEKRAMEIWERDLTLEQAFHLSCVPCYQEIARKIGVEKMKNYIEKFQYGNLDINAGNIDSFWLEGKSRISQFQQIDFLLRFYDGTLPITKRTENIMKRMMIIESHDDMVLSGKTGWAQRDGSNNGWFVGYIEKGKEVYYFATNVTPTNTFDMKYFSKIRKEITLKAFTIIDNLKANK